MTDAPEGPLQGRWSRTRHDWAVSLWVAFLAACLGSFGLFALMDPKQLSQAWVLGWSTDLRVTYGLGFAFLYLVGLFAARLTAFMTRTGPRRGQGRDTAPEQRDPNERDPDQRGEDRA